MKKKKIRNLVLMTIIMSTALVLASTKSVNQYPASNIPKEKLDSFKSDPLLYPLASGWIPNGIAICKESNLQDIGDICSDGEGGAIIVWEDNRTGSWTRSVYAQRINSKGEFQWNPSGVAICTITNNFMINPKICSDEFGGAIITWADNRNGNYDIFAQKIAASGNPVWTANGVPICLNDSHQSNPAIISDMQNGAIIVWSDGRGGGQNIYAQRVDSNGDRKWWENGNLNGVNCSDSNMGFSFKICSDGSGGAIIVYDDYRTGGYNCSIYSQRVSAIGNLVWSPAVPICYGTEDAFPDFEICSDDNEGAFITWCNNRSGNKDVYSQRINSTGDLKWTENGKGICIKIQDQEPAAICYDGFEGAIIAWEDRTISDEGNVYAQRINSTGDLKWNLDGLIICDALGEQQHAKITNDGKGGAYIVWGDEKGGNHDIYAQYVNSSGNPQWATDGIVICDANNRQTGNLILSNGSGGAFIIWNDYRNGDYNPVIYASKVSPDGIVITPLTSGWIPNGTAVCIDSNYQRINDICCDGEGGAIIVWSDNRTGFWKRSVYAQRISSTGYIQWNPTGVAICTIANTFEVDPMICADEMGGAIITWLDNRSGNPDIYAQKVDSNGVIQWDESGVAICTNTSYQWNPMIISDGNNGAIIVWEDDRRDYNKDIYGQRINEDGYKLWWTPEGNGIRISSGDEYNYLSDICSDSLGGAIIQWEDSRFGWNNKSVYAQRVDFNGLLRWNGAEGVAIRNKINNTDELDSSICNVGGGSSIIAWSENRTGQSDPYEDIYAQKLDNNGNLLWTDQGVVICSANFAQDNVKICNDIEGGAIIAWNDERNPSLDDNIYAQRVNSTGDIQWSNDGVEICIANEDQGVAQIISDELCGAVIVWSDERNGEDEEDIYAQHINSEGNVEWTENGKVICNSKDSQSNPHVVYEAGTAIIAWRDYRNGNADIYAQKIEIGVFEEEEIYNIYIQMKNQLFSENFFNVTFYAFNGSNYDQGITDANFTIWWNGDNVTKDLMDDGMGNYSISLEAITLQPGEAPIKLNGTVDAIGFIPQDFEFYIAVEAEVTIEEYDLCIVISKQVYSEEYFNITFYVYNASNINLGIESIIWLLWWNETDVKGDIKPIGAGYYLISLEPITVSPSENPIHLNGTISIIGFDSQNFEFFIAVDPELIDKTPSPPLLPAAADDDDDDQKEKETEFPMITLLVIVIGSAIGIVGVVIVLIKKGIIFKKER